MQEIVKRDGDPLWAGTGQMPLFAVLNQTRWWGVYPPVSGGIRRFVLRALGALGPHRQSATDQRAPIRAGRGWDLTLILPLGQAWVVPGPGGDL